MIMQSNNNTLLYNTFFLILDNSHKLENVNYMCLCHWLYSLQLAIVQNLSNINYTMLCTSMFVVEYWFIAIIFEKWELQDNMCRQLYKP